MQSGLLWHRCTSIASIYILYWAYRRVAKTSHCNADWGLWTAQDSNWVRYKIVFIQSIFSFEIICKLFFFLFRSQCFRQLTALLQTIKQYGNISTFLRIEIDEIIEWMTYLIWKCGLLFLWKTQYVFTITKCMSFYQRRINWSNKPIESHIMHCICVSFIWCSFNL